MYVGNHPPHSRKTGGREQYRGNGRKGRRESKGRYRFIGSEGVIRSEERRKRDRGSNTIPKIKYFTKQTEICFILKIVLIPVRLALGPEATPRGHS